MIFEQFYLECLSQASYLIGDETTKRAVVIDPRRDIAPYLDAADSHDLSIDWVLETHFHADFVSGHLELASATGAKIGISSVANPEYNFIPLEDKEVIDLGVVQLQVLHTPGHTPESACFVVTDRATGSSPWAVFTGDTLFIGDVGRPDLLVSVGQTAEDLAASLYHSIHKVIMNLPDETKVFPGHGAGSSCGKKLSTATSSTIGEQRLTNYAVRAPDQETFVRIILKDQTPPPQYFSHDASLNKQIRPLFEDRIPLNPVQLEDIHSPNIVILDTREPEVFSAGHIKGSINIGLSGRYAEFAGSVLDPSSSIVLVAEPGDEQEARMRLARIGFDHVQGYIANPYDVIANEATPVAASSRITCVHLHDLIDDQEPLSIIDVRNPSEHEIGAISGAVFAPLKDIHSHAKSFPKDKPLVVYCASGYRSSIASSLLKLQGFDDVSELIGGFPAWEICKPLNPKPL